LVVIKKQGIIREIASVYDKMENEFKDNMEKDPKTNLKTDVLYASQYYKKSIREAFEKLEKILIFDENKGKYKSLIFSASNDNLEFNYDDIVAVYKDYSSSVRKLIKIVKDIKLDYGVDVIKEIGIIETNFNGIVNPIEKAIRGKE
jgi:hypothetical protein